MLSVIILSLFVSFVSAQTPISCADLLTDLLECANKQDTTEEVAAIPVTCLETIGASIEDLQICGFLDIAPESEEYLYGEEGEVTETGEVPEPVTLVISDTKKRSKPVKYTKKVRVEVVRKPKTYTKKVIVQPKAPKQSKPTPVPAPVPVPVPVPSTPVPAQGDGGATAAAAAAATASGAGGSAAAEAAAIAAASGSGASATAGAAAAATVPVPPVYGAATATAQAAASASTSGADANADVAAFNSLFN